MRKTTDILEGKKCHNFAIKELLITVKFKWAPITSVEVKRTFSAYKCTLSDRRQSFSSEKLKKKLVIHCYSEND